MSIIERNKLSLVDGKFYTAIYITDLQLGDNTQFGTVISATYDEGSQGTWLITDLNPHPRLYLLFSEIIIEISREKAVKLFPNESFTGG